MRIASSNQAKVPAVSDIELCQRFGVQCLIVGDVYETDQEGKPIPEDDLKKWMVTTPAGSFPASLIHAIPLAETEAQSQHLAAKYLMLRDRERFMSKVVRQPGDVEAKSPAIPTPVYLAFIMDQAFWPWNERHKLHATDVVIEVDGVRFEQGELEPATFAGASEVCIVGGDVFEDFMRLHSLRDHFESWIIGHRPLSSGEANA